MKMKIDLFCAAALMSALCAGFVACNEPNGAEPSDEQRRIEMAKLTDDVYYVAGHYSEMIVFQDDGTAKSGVYLFISENLQDTVAVFDYTKELQPGKLFDGVFEFPAEIMSGSIAGFVLFPKEYRYSFPVRINSHRPLKEVEGFLPAVDFYRPGSSLQINKSIVIESLTKIGK